MKARAEKGYKLQTAKDGSPSHFEGAIGPTLLAD